MEWRYGFCRYCAYSKVLQNVNIRRSIEILSQNIKGLFRGGGGDGSSSFVSHKGCVAHMGGCFIRHSLQTDNRVGTFAKRNV